MANRTRAPMTPNCPQRGRIILAIVAAGMLPSLAVAQRRPVDVPTDSSGRHIHAPLFVKRDAVIAAMFAGTTVLMFPLDKQFARRLQDSATQANRFFKDASTGVEVIASPGAYFIGGSLYLAGKLTGKPKIADLGWHGTEAVIFGEAITHLLKGTLGRARPHVSTERPHDFEFGAGFREGSPRRSFPSGHTTTAFAAASAVTAEVTRWWPQSKWYVGTAMYGGATLVGLSRMYNNKHWASDVALGALIGTFAGMKVVQYTHDHPNNDPDRWMLHTQWLGNAGPAGAANVGLRRAF
jgi:membrane-associated phospholipid phosphatase